MNLERAYRKAFVEAKLRETEATWHEAMDETDEIVRHWLPLHADALAADAEAGCVHAAALLSAYDREAKAWEHFDAVETVAKFEEITDGLDIGEPND